MPWDHSEMGRREDLTSALSSSKTLGKSTFASWISCFSEGVEDPLGSIVEAKLSYWLS